MYPTIVEQQLSMAYTCMAMSTLWVMGCNLYSIFLSGCIKGAANHLMIRLDSVVTTVARNKIHPLNVYKTVDNTSS